MPTNFFRIFKCQQFYKLFIFITFITIAVHLSIKTNTFENSDFSFFSSVSSVSNSKFDLLKKSVQFRTNSTSFFNFIKFKRNGSIENFTSTTSPQNFTMIKTNVSNNTEEKNYENNSTLSSNNSLPICPLVPPKLVGRLKVWKKVPSMDELEAKHPEVQNGGRFKPKECKSRNKVAIIIPYRDREEHLRILLFHLHPMLQRQQLDYGIYVIEQTPNTEFNRAMLINVGFVESMKQYDYECFIFHDVDLIPEDDRNIYSCPEQPRHMSVAIDKFNYKLPYSGLFGGVGAFKKSQMEDVNGFSNLFWGWGAEDDDMYNRISASGFRVIRYPNDIARYTMLSHKKDSANPARMKLLYSGKKRFKTDGLSSLKYKRQNILFKRLYTWIYVELEKL